MPIEFKASRVKCGLLLCGSLAFVAIGVLIVLHGQKEDVWVGSVDILFGGAGVWGCGRRLIDPRPILGLDDHGILDRTLGVGIIPWDEITGAYIRPYDRGILYRTILACALLWGENTRPSMSSDGLPKFISLELRHPEQFVAKLSVLKRVLSFGNRAFGLAAVSLNLSLVTVDSYELLGLILARSGTESDHARPHMP